jgi:hypothetical protein
VEFSQFITPALYNLQKIDKSRQNLKDSIKKGVKVAKNSKKTPVLSSSRSEIGDFIFYFDSDLWMILVIDFHPFFTAL